MVRKKIPARRKSRIVALSLLYSMEFGSTEDIATRVNDTLSMVDTHNADKEYAMHIFNGVSSNYKAIDEKIQNCSMHWKVSRMSLIDRNIIRIGVFELLEQKIPVEVVINEAVEVAKMFGDQKSPAFVNGILDAVAKKIPSESFMNKNNREKS